MKKYFKLLVVILLCAVAVPVLTGCEPKRVDKTFKGEEGTITFSVKEDSGCKISTKKEDLRNSAEQGVLICKDFKIGIEFNDNFNYFFDSDFNKLKAKRKDYDDYKEVTYGDYKGIQYFYGGYMRYDINFPIEGSKEHYLILSVYGKEDNEKSAKAAIKNEEAIDVLNHITSFKANDK